MLTIMLLMLLIVVGGAAAAGGVAWAKRRQLGAGKGPALLPAGSSGGDRLLERTVRDLRVGDVVIMDGRDFLTEGVVQYDEDGHRWIAARVVDGSDAQWMMIGIERAGTSALRLLTLDTETEVSGFPPEVMVIGPTRYALDKRGTATCKVSGDVGGLGGAAKAPRPENHVERCRWWLYNAAGDDTLVLEQWGSDFRVLRGKKISADTIDLIPGS